MNEKILREAASRLLEIVEKCGPETMWRGVHGGAFEMRCHTEQAIIDLRAALGAVPEGAGKGTYDEAVSDLARYLPDGWICHDEYGAVNHFSYEPFLERYSWAFMGGGVHHIHVPLFPRHGDWRTSLRRIQSGKVVPQDVAAGAGEAGAT